MVGAGRCPSAVNLGVGLLVAAGLSACSTTTGPRAEPVGSPTATVTSTASSPRPAIAGSSTVRCGSYIDRQAPAPDLEVVLGSVALPTAPKASALQTAPSGEPQPALRLYAKTGLAVRSGARIEIEVPAGMRNRLAIGWGGAPSTPSWLIRIRCPPVAGRPVWYAYAGGYWLPRTGCLSLIVRVNGREQRVHVGLGTPCPGQQPPQGPSST